ncbi:helix-turn-helix transcriptional regulator [Terriglobus sp.]
MKLTGLCRSALYALQEQGAFPSSITLGTRSARWSELEVRRWSTDRCKCP